MWNSHIHLKELYKFRSISSVLPTLEFNDINEQKACAPDSIDVIYGELRTKTKMYGVFAKKQFKKGEFICTWGGIHVLDDEDLKTVLNYHHLKNYGLAYKSDEINYYACAPLNALGFPLKDGPKAPFINEPDKETITSLSDGKIVVVNREKNNSSYQNICIHTMRRRKNTKKGIESGNIGPVFFAHRDIEIGEELVWSYGREFDRKGYVDHVPKEDNLACDNVQRITFKELTPISSVKDDEQIFMKLYGALNKDVKAKLIKERDSFLESLENKTKEDVDDLETTSVARRSLRETSTVKVESIEKIISDIKGELSEKKNSNNKSLPHRKYVEETLIPILDEYHYKHIYNNIEEVKKEELWKFLELMFLYFAQDLKLLLTSHSSKNKTPVFDKNKYASLVNKGDTANSWTAKSFKEEFRHSSEYAKRFFSMIDLMNDKYDHPNEPRMSKIRRVS
jgi:hypothetical protein